MNLSLQIVIVGAITLFLSLIVNVILFVSLTRKQKGSSDFFVNLFFVSSTVWILSNIFFAITRNTSILGFIGNIAYVSSIVILLSFIGFIYKLQSKEGVTLLKNVYYTQSRLKIVVVGGLLVLMALFFPPVEKVLILKSGFKLIISGSGYFYSVIIILLYIYSYVSLFRLVDRKSTPSLRLAVFTHFLISVLNNLVFVPTFGSLFWWLGPSYVIIISSLIYSIEIYGSAYSLTYFLGVFLRIYITSFAVLASLDYLLVNHHINLVIYHLGGLLSFLEVLLLNLKNKGLVLVPFINIGNLIFSFLTRTKMSELNLRDYIVVLSDTIEHIFRSHLYKVVFIFQKWNKVIIIEKPKLGEEVTYRVLDDITSVDERYISDCNSYRTIFPDNSKVLFCLMPETPITLELSRILDYLFTLGYTVITVLVAQEYLRSFNQRLEQQVNARTAELRQANARLLAYYNRLRSLYKALKTSDEAKTMFISIVSHQLRTPLSVMRNYVDMLESQMYGRLNALQMDILQRIKDAATRLSNLVVDVLQSSRLERGKFTFILTDAVVEDIVKEVVDQYRDMARRKGIKLTLHIHEDAQGVKIRCDKDKLFEAFSNLVDNAIHYTPNGGKVDVYLYKPDNKWIIFAVKDTGIGIPDDQKHKLFAKFTRLDNAKKVRPDGTGIGLYLVKKIVDGHDGKVWFKSKLGKGTTFYIALRLDAEHVEQYVKTHNPNKETVHADTKGFEDLPDINEISSLDMSHKSVGGSTENNINKSEENGSRDS